VHSFTDKRSAIYLVNVAQMLDGRMPNRPFMEGDGDDDLVPDPQYDPNYRVPMMKIVIGGDAPDDSVIPQRLRELPVIDTRGIPRRTFEFKREGFDGEIQWAINDLPFDAVKPLAYPKRGVPEVWTLKNKGIGWVHPVHIHMEEHRLLTRDGINVAQPPSVPNVAGGNSADDLSREDVVALGPGEEVSFYRNFRTFFGPYVTHCHNLAHEDHAMMFAWTIVK
jgi:FtsP/CotA-like multicopper oxidase with cupredoxin domain